MKKSRIFTIISLLTIACRALGCWVPNPLSEDNMIYRLVEDVSPYYRYSDNHSLLYRVQNPTGKENLDLWRKQTGTKLSDESLKWFVYKSTMEELKQKREKAIKVFGQDGYRLLLLAKECESFRDYINDPWYYPYKGDTLFQSLEDKLTETTSYRGRYATRYALQAVRMLVSLKRYQEAVTYWEDYAKGLDRDIVKDMAEQHVARAYLMEGDAATAANIYARHGDLNSLLMCGLDEEKVWQMVYEHCPDSHFFEVELQFLLTHLDNHYLDYSDMLDYYYDRDGVQERKHALTVLALADRATREGRVKNVAMWYYAKAALLDALGKKSQALVAVKAGEKACQQGTFLASSMRVLRIMIEAEVSPLTPAYQARLSQDLKWIDECGRKGLTASVKKKFERERATDWEGKPMDYYYDVVFQNGYFWSDVLSRITIDVVSERLKKAGNLPDALLYANLGEFWVMKNVYGKADSPNSCGIYSTTNLSNSMAFMADSCRSADLIRMYDHIAHPTRGIDSLVVRNGMADRNYWYDRIGTQLITEQKYAEATVWLKDVSKAYQKKLSTWAYFDRDPFCFKIGYCEEKRNHLKNKYDYKLSFAHEMAKLTEVMKGGKTPDERGEAMIRYGVGLRNQLQWCWALSRYSDTVSNYYATEEDSEAWGTFIDISESKNMIDKGIAMLKDRELKAHYLHVFVRNREVMQHYADTEVAQDLRAHCDLWRDYGL